MILRSSRLLGVLLLFGCLVGQLPGQLGDPRALFKEPRTPAEFASRIKFEMDLGNYGVAAQYLHAMLLAKPDEKSLVELEKTEGMASFLKLRNVPRWIAPLPPTALEKDRQLADAREKQAHQDVEELIKLVTDAVRKSLSDPERIRKFVGRLPLGKEEYEYAMGELYRSGVLVVPYIIDELRVADGNRRVAFLRALTQLNQDTLPPIIAALDSEIPALQLDLIAVLRQRGAVAAVPSLYWILGNSVSPPGLREAARDALLFFTKLPADQLPAPRTALTQEAERYYQHKVDFVDPKAVVVWRWDQGRVVAGFPDKPTISASKAEEHYGTRYATQALALDPAYEPAQRVLTSLILDKNYEETGPAKPLSQTRPAVHQRLAALNPEMLTAVLERAMQDRRINVILGALRLLGDQGEVQANRTGLGSVPPLIQALNYPDARVQLVAAETQLKMPGTIRPAIAVRVVDILNRALGADAINKAQGRVLLGYFDDTRMLEVAREIRKMGLEPIPVSSGREVLRRLQTGSDIDAILLDADLPNPGLPNFLGQLKTDRNARNLPIILTSELANYDRWRLYTERNAQVRAIVPLAFSLVEVRRALNTLLRVREEERQRALVDPKLVPVADWTVMTGDEIRWLGEALPILREEDRNRPTREADRLLILQRVQRFLDDERKKALAEGSINAAFIPRPLNIEELRDIEVRMQTRRLNQLLKRDPEAPTLTPEEIRRLLTTLDRVIASRRVWALGPSDTARITVALNEALDTPGHHPLSPEEVQNHAERAIRALGKLARKEIAGYDVRPAATSVYEVLRSNKLSPEGQLAAIDVIGTLTGTRPQAELLAALTSPAHPSAVRVAAGKALVKHIQQFGLILRPNETATIAQLAVDPQLDPGVRSTVTALLGALKPTPRLSGERLQGYQPALNPPMPMPPG